MFAEPEQSAPPELIHRLRLLRELPAHIIPVQNIKVSLHIISPFVLMLKVIGVLPNIDPQHRLMPRGQRTILVGRTLNGHSTVRQLHQSGPSAAEHVHRRVGQLVLKSRDRADCSSPVYHVLKPPSCSNLRVGKVCAAKPRAVKKPLDCPISRTQRTGHPKASSDSTVPSISIVLCAIGNPPIRL
jgi:hypothetical protein